MPSSRNLSPRTAPLPESGRDDPKNAEKLADMIAGYDQLSPLEQAELTRLAIDLASRALPVQTVLKDKPDGGKNIQIQGDCAALGRLKLQKMFAATTMDPVNARASEILKYLGSVGADSTDRYNAVLSFIEGMEPNNQAEALLLVQMYCTHDAAMRSLAMIGAADWTEHAQIYGNLAAKLLRASGAQMDALARMRRGGEQVVRHVHVDNRGGQAVIAKNVCCNGGGREN